MPKTTAAKPATDFLAIVFISGGSSWARNPDKEKAIQHCARLCHSDWSSLFDMDGKEVPVNVFDVAGHNEVTWDFNGVRGDGPNKIECVEVRKVTLPTKRRK